MPGSRSRHKPFRFQLPQGVAAVRVDVSRSHGDLEAGRMVAGACAEATGCGSSLRLSAL